MRILLAGEESAGMQVLRSLVRGPHELVAVLTTPAAESRGDVSLARVAAKAGVPTLAGRLVERSAFAGQVTALGVDLLLNVHSLHLVHADVVAAPRLGSFNLHPGLLPEYAGLNSASWAIYQGAAAAGVTLHWMDPGIDTGDIAYRTALPIADDDTALTLNARCVREGLRQIEQLLAVAATDAAAIPRLAQDRSRRRYYGRQVPEDGCLQWTWPAARVLRFVRACDYAPFRSPWGHPRTRLGARELGIAKAERTGEACASAPGTIGAERDGGVLVAAADEWLKVDLVEVDATLCKATDALSPHRRQTLSPA